MCDLHFAHSLLSTRADPLDFVQILISYMTQSGIVLFTNLLVHLIRLPRTISGLITAFRVIRRLLDRKRPESFPTNHRHLKFLQGIGESNLAHSTSTLLVDFQEAQCFFVIAVQISVLYANSQGASFSGAQNWESLRVNREAVWSLANIGAWSISLTQITLFRSSMDSWYTLALSFVALVLAATASKLALLLDTADNVYKMFKNETGLDECGGNASMRTFCSAYSPIFTLGVPRNVMFINVPILGLLCFMKVWTGYIDADTSLSQGKRLNDKALDSTGSTKSLERVKRIALMLVTLFLFSMEVLLLALLIIGLQSTQSMLVTLVEDETTNLWNVGQVVAVLVWAPVLSKYTYSVLCKSTS